MVAQKDNEPMSGLMHEPMSGPMHEPMSGPIYELSYYRTPQGMDRRLDIRCRVKGPSGQIYTINSIRWLYKLCETFLFDARSQSTMCPFSIQFSSIINHALQSLPLRSAAT